MNKTKNHSGACTSLKTSRWRGASWTKTKNKQTSIQGTDSRQFVSLLLHWAGKHKQKAHKWDFLKEVCWWLLPPASPQWPLPILGMQQSETKSKGLPLHNSFFEVNLPSIFCPGWCEVWCHPFLGRAEQGCTFTSLWVGAKTKLPYYLCLKDAMVISALTWRWVALGELSHHTGLLRSSNSMELWHSRGPALSAPAVPTHLELLLQIWTCCSQSWPHGAGCHRHGGTLPKEQDEGPGLCCHRQFPVKELMWDEGPQRAVILVRQSTPMGCQILTIGAAGWAPVGLIFHCLLPHCLKQQKGDHQKLSLVPSVSFQVIHTSQLCIPLHQHISLVTSGDSSWKQMVIWTTKTKFWN